MISQERLRQLLRYEPTNGVFTWLVYRRPGICPGEIAGTLRDDGYIRIQIDGVRMYASHWAWLYMTGELPKGEVDHCDRNRANNAWENLRLASKSQNCANRQTARGPDRLRGVTRYKTKFKAQIRVLGNTKYLGLFDTAEAAHAAYLAEAKSAFDAFATANDNTPNTIQRVA